MNRYSPKHLHVGISSTTGEAIVPQKNTNMNRHSPENLRVGISSTTGEAIVSPPQKYETFNNI